MSSTVSFAKEGRIGVATIDNPPVNALSHSVRAGLADAVAQSLADPSIAALVIVCAGRTFIAGADIREFGKPMEAPLLGDVIEAIEGSSKPVVAAIHGTALGGGLEVALACHFRVAAPGSRLGLPEVKLGILPGAGGTQRLPRLVGVETALKMITEGSEMPAADAEKRGLVDAILEGDLKTAAVAFAERVVAEGRPIRRTGELSVTLDNPAIFDEFKKTLAKRQRGFEAPQKCVDAVRLAVELPLAEGLKREHEMCVELLNGAQSKAQRHNFAAEREVAKIPGLPDTTPVRDVKKVAVIGPGVMGTGIAICFLNAGIPTVLVGLNEQNAEGGANAIRKNYGGSVARGSLKQEEMDKRLGLLTVAASYDALKDVDLVVEAVFEDMAVKQEVFAKLGKACKPGAILATNTSYLDIDALAAAAGRPQDVVGMHFFNPANVMRLLENVRGAATAPDVLATVMKVGKTIKKISVLVGVSDGFVGNRMLAKRSREGFFLLEEGATPWQIDKVLYDFGFAMGPYQVADLAGIDVQYAARKARYDRLGAREKTANIVEKLYEMGRYGQKTGAGYYKYDEKRNATPDPEIEALIVRHSAERGIARRPVSDDEIRDRLLFAMINEGAKILDEGVAARPHDIDIIWLNGYGFPAYRGGPMYYADQVGLKTVYESILKYRDQVGEEYFTPSPLLERLAKAGKGFYSQ